MSSTSLPLRLSAVAALVSAALSAHAQQALEALAAAEAGAKAPKPAEAQALQKVEVRGTADAYNPRRDDTASKIVVNHDEIVRYGDTNVLDVLKRLPGITVSGAAGRGGEVRMRGLGSGYTQVLINGERAPAGFSLDSLAPDVIERIEVLRAASAEFSTQSIAGTINIVLKKAVTKAQRELKLTYARAHGFVAPSANLQLSDRAGSMSYSLSVNATHHDFERDVRTDETGMDQHGLPIVRAAFNPEHGHWSALNIAPRLNWTLAGGDTVTWQSFLNANRFKGRGVTLVTTLEGEQADYPLDHSSFDSTSTFLRSDLSWVRKLGQGAKLDTKLGATVNRHETDQRRLGFDADGDLALDTSVDGSSQEHGYSSTGKYTTPIREGHALAMGWDGGYNQRADERVEGALVEEFDVTVARIALFAQDEWNLTPRWSVYLGARWEGIDTRSAGNRFDTARARTSVVSPLLQTLWKLAGDKGDQLRFAVTRTYKAPAAQSLTPRRFTSVNNSNVDPDRQGNPRLRPELALGLDASYEHYWGEGALLSVSASARRLDGYVRNGLIEENGRWIALPVNSGKAHTRGLELEAKFPLKAVMDDAPALDLRASLSRNWSKVDSVPGPNNRLAEQTPYSATVGADYKRGALTAGGSFAIRGGGPVRSSLTQSSYQSVRRDLELYALWKFDPKNQLRVAAVNVLGQDWIHDTAYSGPSGSLARRAVYPGAAMLRATMEMKF